MRTTLSVVCVLTVLGVAGCKSGLESKACVDYFAKTEQCAAKTKNKIKADAWRKSAEVSREQFKKNLNPMAVEKSCEMMAETLAKDPDCQ